MGNSTPLILGDYLGNIAVDTFLELSQVVEYSPNSLKLASNYLEVLATSLDYGASLEALKRRNQIF
jgi:hypothetical protein